MAQDEFDDWSVTSSNNIAITGDGAAIDIDEGCAPGNVNDAMRAIMSAAVLAFGNFPRGTSRPSYLTAGKFWLNTTTATAPILTYYDGTDNIAFATFNHTANTIALSAAVSGGSGIANVVEDTTPQLGGNLDLNGSGITLPGATVTDVTGADTLLVSGTAGTSGDLAQWNVDGDLVDGPTPPSGTIVGTTDTQTLTNKTIDGSLNTITNVGGHTVGTAKATTSGTSSEFTSLPAGLEHIEIAMSLVSTNGTSGLRLEVGHSAGSWQTSGYVSGASNDANQTNDTTAFAIVQATAGTSTASGVLTLSKVNDIGDVWALSGNLYTATGAAVYFCAGSVIMSAELDAVRLTTVGGADTFDAGQWNIKYW